MAELTREERPGTRVTRDWVFNTPSPAHLEIECGCEQLEATMVSSSDEESVSESVTGSVPVVSSSFSSASGA